MSSGIDLINPAQCQLHAPRITTITLVTPGHQRPILHYCSKRSICGMDLINSCQCRLHALRFTSSIWTPQATSVPSFTTSANASHVEQVLSKLLPMPHARSQSHHPCSSHPGLPRPMLYYCSKSMFYGIDLLNSTQSRLHAPRVTTIALDTPRHHRPILHYCSKRTASGIDLINFFQSRLRAPRIATQTLVTSGHHRLRLHSQLTTECCGKRKPCGIDLLISSAYHLHALRVTTIPLLTPGHHRPNLLICCPVTITQQATFTSQLLPSHQCSSPQPQPIHRLCGISHLQQRDPLQLPQNLPQFRILSSPQCQGMSLLSPLPFQPPPCLQTSSSLLARGSQNSKD